MTKKTIYKTIIQVEVLSEEPIHESMSLDQIEEECNTGSFSGIHTIIVSNKPIKGIAAVKEMRKQGSSPEFFQMDENGNDIDF